MPWRIKAVRVTDMMTIIGPTKYWLTEAPISMAVFMTRTMPVTTSQKRPKILASLLTPTFLIVGSCQPKMAAVL